MAAPARRRPTRLDVLALEDRLAPAAVQDRGVVPIVYLLDGNGQPRQSVVAYPGAFTGGVWVASADVTGDGTADLVSAPGPGGGPQVKVFDGATGQVVRDFMAYEPAFTGGIYAVAADFTGDGRAEIVTGTDQGGGPRVRVLDGATGAAVADFLAIDDANFRGGVRVSTGDVNGDGTPDLVVSAGFGGGPRIAGFDGAALAGGAVVRLFSDFFAFEPALRNGAYPAVGDVNGDGFGDLLFGAGPGGGPRVVSYDGRAALAGRQEMGLNFFAGDVFGRDGVRVSGVSVGGTQAGVLTAGGSGGPAFLYDGGGVLLGQIARDVAFNGGLFDDASGRDVLALSRNAVSSRSLVLNLTFFEPGSVWDRVPWVTGTASATDGIAGLTARVDGGPEVAVAVDPFGDFDIPLGIRPDASAVGPHSLTLRLTDRRGGAIERHTPFTISSIKDYFPASSRPATYLQFANSAVSIRAVVDDGPPAPVPIRPDGLYEFTPVLPLDGSADGRHTVRITGTDAAGRRVSWFQYTFVLDTRPPVVTVNTFADPDGSVGGTVRDAGTGPGQLLAEVDEAGFFDVPVDPTTGAFRVPTGLPAGAAGSHVLRLLASDRAFNAAPASTHPFVFDTLPPVVAVTSLAPGTTVVVGTATDPGAGVRTVVARLDGGATVPATFDAATGRVRVLTGLPADGSADGPHTVTVQATDAAGNTSAPTTFGFTLDTRPAPFADPDLARAAAAALNLPAGRLPSRTDLLALTDLTADSNVVSDLGGLENAANLQSFALRPTDAATPGGLVGLAPLAGLTRLTSLSLVGAGVTTAQLAALAGRTSLRELDLRYNPLTSVAAVAGLPALETLRLHGTAVTDLSPLAGKPVHTDREPAGAENAFTVPALARALEYSPLRIVEFVTNTIELQLYKGHLKGARATLETRAGNDWDQANLLAELLRESGVRVRFVTGTIEAPVATVEAWLGATTRDGASSILATLGLRPEYVYAGAELMLRFDHAWLQAEFAAAGGGTRWVDLDPSWKFKAYRAAQPNMLGPVPFAEAAYLAAPRAEGAVEFYAGQVAAHLAATGWALTLADLPYDGPIRPQTLTSLPAARPYAVAGSLVTTDTVPAELEWGATVTLSRGGTTLFSHPLVMSAASLDRIVVEYAPAGGGQVTPKLVVGGTVVAQGPAVAAGAAVTLTVGQTQPDGPARSFTYGRTAGQFVAVGLNGLQVSERLLARERDAIAAAAADARAGRAVDPDEQIGAVLALAMARWYAETGRAEALMNGLTGGVSVYAGNMSQGVATSDSTVTYHWDLPIPAVPDGAGVDIPNYYHQELSRDGSTAGNEARRRVIGFNGSAEENAVWEALLNSPSVSTVKSLQLAASRGVPVYDITPATQGTFLPLLNLDSSTEAQIGAELAAGATVTVPRDPTPLDDWAGVGYLSRRPDGFTKYIISGGLNGATPAPTAGGYSGGRPGSGARPGGDNPYEYTTVGDPVDVSNGAVTRDESDFVLPAAGLPLAFGRRYNSQITRDAGMGPGWSFTYSDALAFHPDGSISWTDGAGARNTFTPNGAGGFTLPVTLSGSFVAAGGGYTYTDARGLVRRFDAAGRLQYLRDRNGNELTVGRDGSGRVSAVWDADAPTRRLTFAYAAGLLASVTDHTGRAWRYFYTAGRLTRAEAPADAATPAAVVRYEYHTEALWAGLLAAVTEPNGGRTTFAYTADGRARRVTDAAGTAVTYAYNLFRRRTDYADERGHVTTYTTNAVGNVVARTDPDGARLAWTWVNNLVTAATDAFGAVTTYQYDARGNLTRAADPLGRVTATAYDPVYSQPTSVTLPGGRVTTYVLDARGNPTRMTDAAGGVTAMTYDSRGLVRTVTSPRGAVGDPAPFTVTFTYNDAGQVLTRTTGLPSVETFTYDAAGRRATATDANGHTTTFAHDALDRVVTVTDAAGGVASRTYDAIGDVTATTDVLGRTTRYRYDLKQQLVATTFADGALWTAAYDPLGNRTAARDELGRRTGTALDERNRPVAAVGDDGSVALTAFDGGGRVRTTTDANGNVTTFAYDVLGRLSATRDALGVETTRTYDDSSWLESVTDPLGRATTFTYDRLGRLLTSTNELGHTTAHGYDADGNRTSTTDPLGHTATAAYDVLGRPTAATDAAGRTTRTGYDPVGNVVSVTDPAGNVTTFAFDALNRLTRATDALGAARTYAYDAAGNLLTLTDRLGRVTAYDYDARDRRTAERWLVGGAAVRTVLTGYDHAGQVVSATDPDSATAWTYDALGRLESADLRGTPGLPRVVQTYTRDAAGNVRTVATTADDVVADVEQRGYDALNRLSSVSRSAMAAAFTYDAAGALDTVTRAAGGTTLTTATYAYDAAGRHTGLAYSHGTAFTWVLDAAGRATSESGPDGTATFGYDAANQLTSAALPGRTAEVFAYDANGNRTGGGYQTGADNRLLADGTFTYASDAEGNRTLRTTVATGATTRYTWDHRNRLTAVTDATAAGVVVRTVGYAYDTADRLISRTETAGGATTAEHYVHDGDRLALAFDADGDVAHRHLFGPYVDQVVMSEDAAGAVSALVTDRRGSVREVLAAAGAAEVRYDAFGRPEAAQAGLSVGFAGRPTDAATGLSNNRARWYDPATGRFVNPDPSSFAGGDANLYRYAGNDPVNATDPTGLRTLTLGRRDYGPLEFGSDVLFGAAHVLIGVGDSASFGATRWVREQPWYGGDTVDYSHPAYKVGDYGFTGLSLVVGVGEIKAGVTALQATRSGGLVLGESGTRSMWEAFKRLPGATSFEMTDAAGAALEAAKKANGTWLSVQQLTTTTAWSENLAALNAAMSSGRPIIDTGANVFRRTHGFYQLEAEVIRVYGNLTRFTQASAIAAPYGTAVGVVGAARKVAGQGR